MILLLSETCPIFRPEAEIQLHNLLSALTMKRRHILAGPAPDRLHAILPKHLWDLYGEYLSRSFKQAVNSYQTWVHAADCARCNAEKLALYCDLPAVLIVENVSTDGAWLKLLVRKLRPRIARHMDGRYVDLDLRQAGGIGEIPKELERVAQRYRDSLPAETMPLRVVALADSDSIMPGAMSAGAREVQKAADHYGAQAHILSKRTIENYVPDSSLHTYASHRPDYRIAINFITSLKVPARDHYDMKKGLSEEEIEATGNMYPADTPLKLKIGDFIADFIDDMGTSVEASELRSRDGVNELDGFLDLIEANL